MTKPTPSSEAQNPSLEQGSPHVDVERFRAELREAGVEEMIGTLLTTFAQDAPARFAALEQATQNQDAKAVERAAHAFKSGAGTIHATRLAAALSDAEAAGRSGQLQTTAYLLEQIRVEYLAVVRELEATASNGH